MLWMYQQCKGMRVSFAADLNVIRSPAQGVRIDKDHILITSTAVQPTVPPALLVVPPVLVLPELANAPAALTKLNPASAHAALRQLGSASVLRGHANVRGAR